MTHFHNVVFYTNQQWASSLIRGKQVAEMFESYCDPGYVPKDADTVVFVKSIPERKLLDLFVEHNFRLIFDVVDTDSYLFELAKIPRVEFIAIGISALSYIRSRVFTKVWLIPEFHIPSDVKEIKAREVKTVGFIGYKDNLRLDVEELGSKLSKQGIKLKTCFNFETQQDVVNFYKSIDLQVCFRPPADIATMPPEMKNPLKLVNAGAFAVPTIAYPECSYVAEWRMDVDFMAAYSLDGIVNGCLLLKDDPDQYLAYACNSYIKAQEYDKDVVAGLYKNMFERRNS